MKLISTERKPHGMFQYTFSHEVKGEKMTFAATGMNEKVACTKVWSQVSEAYKAKKNG